MRERAIVGDAGDDVLEEVCLLTRHANVVGGGRIKTTYRHFPVTTVELAPDRHFNSRYFSSEF